MVITSKSNEKIKLIKSLYQKKYRDKHSLFIIEGKKFVLDTLHSNKDKIKYIITTDLDFENFSNILYVNEEIYKYISDTKTPQGYMAIAHIPIFEEKNINFDEIKNAILLDNMQDGTNTGALIRTAACADFSLAITTKSGADPFSPKAVRASAASVLSMNILRIDNYDVLLQFKEKNFDIIASTLNGNEALTLNDSSNVLVVGNEGSGISDECLSICNKFIKIPISGKCESLNASISGSILIYKIIGYFN